MPFMPLNGMGEREVPPIGSKENKICIVGEAPGEMEAKALTPFVGPAGAVLNQCLNAAGIVRSECYITNVVKVRPKGNDISPYFNPTGFRFTDQGLFWLKRLYSELEDVRANVFIALGQTAFTALTGADMKMKIGKRRGYVHQIPSHVQGVSTGSSVGYKVIPCYHPSYALRGNYISRYIITADLKKARIESKTLEYNPPERDIRYRWDSLGAVLVALEEARYWPRISVDIEVINFEMSCISISPDPHHAFVIPIHGRWDLWDEMQIWRALATVLENPFSIKTFQNGIFDIQFLAYKCGIMVPWDNLEDTMLAHSIMYIDLPKGLDFLVSIYGGSQPYYKDMVKFNNIKKEA